MSLQSGKQNRHDWVVIALCAATTLGLGYIGFHRYWMAKGDPRPPLNLFYLALQLFTLESGSVPGEVPLSLDAARLAAPVIAAWAGVKVLFQVFREELETFRLRCFRDHIVICGLGDKALHYVQDFLKTSKVVVIERDPENDRINSAKLLGARVLIGDARFREVLSLAKVGRAKRLIATTADDLANMEIAEVARAIPRSGKSGPLHAYVHVANPQVLEAAKVHERLWERSDEFIPNVFSICRDAARAIFEARPLDWRPIRQDSDLHAHLVVVGFGKMGENILLQAARIGHFANQKRLRVTVVDRSADVKWQRFLFRYPNIGEVCDVEKLSMDAESSEVIAAVQKIASDEHALTSVVICFNSDERSLAYAVGLREKMGDLCFPISVRMPQESLFCRVLSSGKGFSLGIFGTCSECCTAERILGETEDITARRIHEHYRQTRLSEKGADPETLARDPALKDWEMLREDFRESNRQQADHIPVKLRAFGYDWRRYEPSEIGGSDDFKFPEDEVKIMAIMEHERWNAERWLAGWRKGQKDKARKITPWLAEWEKLPDDIKEYDLEFVRNIPNLLKIWPRAQS